VTTKPVSLRDTTDWVRRIRRAFERGVGDVRSNHTVCGLLAIAEQWVDEQGRIKLTDLIDLSKCPAKTEGRLPPCAHPASEGLTLGMHGELSPRGRLRN
jgi:hypothetical protein